MDYSYNSLDYQNQDQSISFKMLIDRFFRRFLDLLLSIIGLVLLSPLFLWVALRLRNDSEGPIFFRGKRAGLHGKPFEILKFRTMYDVESSYNGSAITAGDDERVTELGKFLRDSKLNEIPQLWNVLKGDMSLVGPRPEAVSIADLWPEDVRDVILSVRPGITSPASVLYRSEEKLLTQDNVMEDYLRSILPSKLRLDMLYVRNRSLLTDIDVILWTAIALLPALRNRQISEGRLFWGPLAQFFSRFLTWFVIDTAIVFSSALVSELIWRTSVPINLGYGNAIIVSILIGLVFSLINVLFGLNRVTWSRAAATDAFSLSLSAALSTAVLIMVKLTFLDTSVLPVGLLITTGLLSFFGFVILRYRERLITGAATRWMNIRSGKQTLAERVLIIGAGDNGELAIWLFQRHKLASAFTVYGILDDDPRKRGMRVNGVEVLGTIDDLADVVADYDIGLIVYTIYNVNPTERYRLIRKCNLTNARLVILPDVMAQLDEDPHLPINLNEMPTTPLTIKSRRQYLHQIEQLARAGDVDGIVAIVNTLQTILEKEEEKII